MKKDCTSGKREEEEEGERCRDEEGSGRADTSRMLLKNFLHQASADAVKQSEPRSSLSAETKNSSLLHYKPFSLWLQNPFKPGNNWVLVPVETAQ